MPTGLKNAENDYIRSHNASGGAFAVDSAKGRKVFAILLAVLPNISLETSLSAIKVYNGFHKYDAL